MEAVIVRIDDLEVASFIDRVALFAEAGCNPQLALRFCRSSLEGNSALCQEMSRVLETSSVRSPVDVLSQVSRRTGSEWLHFTGLAFAAHLGLGAEISGPLARLAGVVRWHHRAHLLISAEHVREFEAAMFAYKMDFLTEIDKSPAEALAIVAERDSMLGPELARMLEDLAAGFSLSRVFARAAERTGIQGLRLLAAGMEVAEATGTPRATMLRHTADAIRREIEA